MSDTTTVDATACPAPAANPAIDLEHVAELADSVSDLVRAANRGRQWWLAAAAENVEWSTLAVLRCLRAEGPMRASASPSRSASTRPPSAGRSPRWCATACWNAARTPTTGGPACSCSLPGPTPSWPSTPGPASTRLAELVADWPATELEDFSTRLRRFVDAYDRMITERSDEQHARSRSNH